MKIPALLLLLAVVTAATAQKTDFDFLKVKFKVSKQWHTDGFGDDYPWEEGGSSVCECSGVIITNDFDEKNLRIVIYPTTRAGLDSVKRQRVWSYEFVPVERSEVFQTPYFRFAKKISRFKDITKSDPDEAATPIEVWQFLGQSKGNYYVIYVFAENFEHPQLAPHAREIEAVLKTIQEYK